MEKVLDLLLYNYHIFNKMRKIDYIHLGRLFAMLALIPCLIFLNACGESESSLMNKAKKDGYLGGYVVYLKKYPNGKFVSEALDSLYVVLTHGKYPYQLKDIYRYSNVDYVRGTKIEKPLKDYIYNQLIEKKSESYWQEFISYAESQDLRNAKQELANLKKEKSEIEITNWGTEDAAWETAVTLNHPNSYKKYTELYPTGKHFRQAKERYINLQIDRDFGGTHGDLPTMEQITRGGSVATISVSNGTDKTLTVLYSGSDFEELVLSPHSVGNVSLSAGSYRISARVNDYHVTPFAGYQTLTGGNYQTSYYIVRK